MAKNINHVFYADDLCLMAPCEIALQELINICYKYSIEIDMNFNALKSFCMAFITNVFKLKLPSLRINSWPIAYTDTVTYLGYIFSNNKNNFSLFFAMYIKPVFLISVLLSFSPQFL